MDYTNIGKLKKESPLSQELDKKVKSELQVGERIIWSASPNPNQMMKAGFALWFFFIPWTAFSIFWMAGAAGFKMPTFDGIQGFFWMFGIPFFLIGLGGLSAPALIRKSAKSTVYVITDKRAFSIVGSNISKVKNFDLTNFRIHSKIEKADGSGDLIFERFVSHDSDGRTNKDDGFYAIKDVKRVEGLLFELAGRVKGG